MFCKNKFINIIPVIICFIIAILISSIFVQAESDNKSYSNKEYIKWVKFNIPSEAMEKALKADIENHDDAHNTPFITLLSLLGAKYWGEWEKYKAKDMDYFIDKLKSGESENSLSQNYEKFPYFQQVYQAIFAEMIGKYHISKETDPNGNPIFEEKYGLKAYSPIAYGYKFSHCRDFGNSRSFGYRRNHLGNDLMSQTGTPIVAVESGIVAKCAWNKYGGWRIGIRSFDGKRYYYYAHCQKDHPFIEGLKEGDTVCAGQPIAYVGMTGYSTKENVNGMQKPHLHFGMQLIFDPSQEEGKNEIWIDVYDIVNFLEHHKSVLTKNPQDKDYKTKYLFKDPTYTKFVKST